MTPTEQEKKLREQIADALRTGYHGIAETKVINRVLELITTDRERVELEARIDELKHLIVDGGIWYQDMTRQFPQKITLNERIKELEA